MSHLPDNPTNTLTLEEPDLQYINQQLNHARQLQANDQHQKAIPIFQEICEHYPLIHQAWGNMGASYAALGQKKAAIRALERAIQVRPDYDLARRNLEEIKTASAEQLRQQSFINNRAGVLDIGIMQLALDEWMDILTTKDLNHIPALRDVTAWLDHLENTPATTDKHDFLDFDTVLKLNQLLASPDPLEQTFASPDETSKTKPYYFKREPQFPTVWRLRHLLEIAELIKTDHDQLIVTPDIADFRSASPAEQYAALLWKYLHDLSWPDLEKTSRPGSKIIQMDKIQQDMAKLIQNVTSRRINQILIDSGPRYHWVDPLATARFPQTKTTDHEQQETEVVLLTMYAYNETKYLWQPFQWFNLIELQTQPWLANIPMLTNIRPTPLGSRLLPTIALREDYSENISAPPAGRNDPCPCGAAKSDGQPIKYKKCHGR